MSRTNFILTLLLTLTLGCFGQNKTTKEALNTGKWTEVHEDGIWQTADSTGNILKTEYWDKGLNLWTKYFDEHGNLSEYEYYDIKDDTHFYLTYKNNQLYKKAFYPPENKNQQTEIFYPDNNLLIPDAEPAFYSKFSDIAPSVFQLKLSCKKDLTIISVRSGSKNIHVNFPLNAPPFRLTPKDTACIDLIFTPTPASFSSSDTITIVTSEENVLPYKVYCSLRAFHIDGSNVETLQEISLSKTKDRYLFIAPMGTITEAIIQHSDGTEKRYDINQINQIDLKELEPGEYALAIYSCNTGGYLKLKISE